MEQERWQQVSDLFWNALERPAADREVYLRSGTGDDAVRDEVLAMLAAHNESAGLRVERRFVSGDGDTSEGLPTGTIVGPFRVLSLIGRGGMGEVYRAERADGEFEQVVAIKLLRPDARSPDFVRRFRAERTLLARMTHPNIAAVLDGGTAPDGRPYLVLRFIDGEPITRYAERLQLSDRLRLFVKVADAVQFAHARLVVHRDIKPSNILVGADGEPVLLDFGIAKLLDGSDSEERTRTGRSLLTPSHAAPEQVRGDTVTTATDVYGLGAVLFEMLTGLRVFNEAASAAELERAILEMAPPAPSSAVNDVSLWRALRGDLDRIVLKSLRKEPERRYASAADFARDVERHLANRPVLAQPDRWTYRASRFARRNRAAVAASFVAVSFLSAIAVREVNQARRLAEERDRAVREQSAGEDALAFVTDLFEQSNPRVVPGGDTLRVGAFLERAEGRATALSDQPERQMRVYRVLGNVRASRGDYAVAESLLTLARDIGARQLGDSHIEVLRTELQLGLLVREFRSEATARPMLDGVVRRMIVALGPDHAELAQGYLALASVVDAPDSLRVLLDRAIAVRSRASQPDSVDLAALLDEEAREKGLRGRFGEATALDESALRLLQQRLPSNHPNLLSVKGNLATWLGGMAEWNRALPLAEDILGVAKRQTTAGEPLALAHERVAILKANLPGRLAEAEAGIIETLRIFRGTVAPEHVLITSSMRNLAIVMSHQGREREALVLMDSAISRNLANGQQDAALYLRGQQVPMLIRLGRIDDAIRSAQVAAESRTRLPGGSRYRADLTYWLGLATLAAARYEEAARFLGSAHEDISDDYPPGHPRSAMATCALGVALARAGRPEEARVHLVDACPRLDRWGLADPTVVRWAKQERARLGIPGT